MENHDLLLDNALDAVIGIDPKGLVIYWNRQAEETFGWTRAEALGQDMSYMIVPERYRTAHRRGMQHFLATGEGPILNHRIEIPALRRNGTEFPSELTVSPLRQGGELSFFSFIRDITHQKETENERVRLLEEAQNAIKARDEFLGICSHELKTPVTSLSLQFQLAEKRLLQGDLEVLSKEISLKRVKMANRQLHRLTRLIDDMLDLSRISIGKMHFEPVRFEINQLIAELVERFQIQSGMEGSELKLHSSEPVEILADRDRIEQAVTNLLTNAIKYGDGNAIRVEVRMDHTHVFISVKDEGPGIAPENAQRIFEKFERGVSSMEISGMGVGLFITRTIVEANGGTIRLESEIDQGSTFIVCLPKA